MSENEWDLKLKATKKLRKFKERYPDSSGDFYYIAGHTSNGFPYGISWEEWEEEIATPEELEEYRRLKKEAEVDSASDLSFLRDKGN